MRIYLDVSCLNRPFDDQKQDRIRYEAEAVERILARIDDETWLLVSSEIVEIEAAAALDSTRRAAIKALVKDADIFVRITEGVRQRAAQLVKFGFKPADATHIAAAEAGHADVCLTCDDRMCRRAKAVREQLHTLVVNPVVWWEESDNAENA